MKRVLLSKAFLSILAILGLAIVVLAGASTAGASQVDEVDLSIGLKAPQHVEPGGTFVLNVSYSNLGTAASPLDTWVKVTLPAGASFVSATDRAGIALPPATSVDNVLTWQVGAVMPGICCQHILVTVQVDDKLANDTVLTSQAEIGSSAVESNLANNTIQVTSTVCDMAGSSKQAQVSRVKPGDAVMYTLTIRMIARNGMDASAPREVELTDYLPPATQARFLGWVGEMNGTYDGEMLRWRGQVRAGEAVTLQYRLGIEGEVPAGSRVTNRARLSWNSGEMDLDPVDVDVYLDENDHMFGPQGGQWQLQYGLTLEVPPNALQATTRFEFRPLFEDNPPPAVPPGNFFAHRAFTLTAFQFGEVHRFNQPITITIGYKDSDVQGLNRNTLRLWYRAGSGEPWAMLGEPQSHQNGQIRFTTDHFTEFALFGEGAYRLVLPYVSR